MARPRKEGRKETGVYSKNGMLYIVISKTVIKNGKKKYVNEWIPTKLEDTAENVKKAVEQRKSILSEKDTENIDKNITIEDFLKIYLSEKERLLANTTYAGYKNKSKHIQNYFSDIKVKDITASYINDFLDSLFTQKNLATRTVKDVKTIFHNIMEFAVSKKIITNNPVKSATINKQLANEHSTNKFEDEEFFSYEEALLFLEEAKKHRLYFLFHTTLIFGLRRSEVLGLKWDAIDFDNKVIKIQSTVTHGTRVNRTNSTKTDESKDEFPLSDEQIEEFRKLKDREQKYREEFGNSYQDNDYIFKKEDGSLYYPDYPTTIFRKIKKKCKSIPQEITFHGLRKSCASILVHKGYDIKQIQKWMRHADPETTLKIYAKVKEKESKKVILKDMIETIPIGVSIIEKDSNY